ncbi:glutamate racemase [Duganella sp. CF402]|uniref:glutamate racemase n=1 Tax=unclassified Duganella TaxID=2636909 RepID=UPI0008CD4346|nr:MULTISPECIES: glutamate racemase [unclassified Duganella]RZT04283.1 glutamate racemase [Duganella sp. BK701]SEM41592.1 glutamate racemase [Duganella sp. CF402]
MPVARSPGAPIGVFDSGVGGLSVLRHICAQLPHEEVLYFADSGHAPYGDKTEEYVVERALAVTAFLLSHGAKALVVACNTATVAAIKAVRARYPELPVVGVEPGLKPAAAATRSGKVGVLATARTLKGEKFLQLREQISAATQAEFLLQPAVGLVNEIEKGDLHSPAIADMLERYVAPLLDQGADTLVLGCTHYPFVRDGIERVLREHARDDVTLIDTGDAVARQLVRLLEAGGLLRASGASVLRGYTTGDAVALAQAFADLLGLQPAVEKVDV